MLKRRIDVDRLALLLARIGKVPQIVHDIARAHRAFVHYLHGGIDLRENLFALSLRIAEILPK